MNLLTVNQRRWFDKNEKNMPLIYKWASKGEVTTVSLVNFETGERSYGVTCRGARISSCDDKDKKEALRKGKAYREKMLEESKSLPEIDERKLHIDGSCVTVAQKLGEVGANIQGIIFLGQWCFGDGPYDDRLQEFVSRLQEKGHHKSLRPLATLFAKAMKEMSKEDMNDREGEMEVFSDCCRQLGYYGFVAEVACPVKSHFTENSYSLSWGHFYSAYMYGDDIEQIVEAIPAQVAEWEKKDRKFWEEKKKKEK